MAMSFIIKVKGLLAGLQDIYDPKKLQPVVLSLLKIIIVHYHRKIVDLDILEVVAPIPENIPMPGSAQELLN